MSILFSYSFILREISKEGNCFLLSDVGDGDLLVWQLVQTDMKCVTRDRPALIDLTHLCKSSLLLCMWARGKLL